MRRFLCLSLLSLVCFFAAAQDSLYLVKNYPNPFCGTTNVQLAVEEAGIMMQIGDLSGKPYLVGIAPCTGFGFYDMDLVLPVELRFGRYLTNRWYLMGELTYHVSLANETACIEPVIRIGYNFGRKVKRP